MKLDILKTEDIYLKSFKYVASKSKSNTLPYHNIDHALMVFNNAYLASQYYKLDEVLRPTATKELCVAALFHDSNHSGGKLTDSENINNSVTMFKEFFTEYSLSNKEALLDGEVVFMNNVIDINMATEFPHKDFELSIQQKIIRDCDMMSITQENHVYNTIFGLGSEFGVDVKTQVNNQIVFTLNLRKNLNTEWAIDKLDEKIGGVMNDLGVLSKMFRNDSYIIETPLDLNDDFAIKDGKKIII